MSKGRERKAYGTFKGTRDSLPSFVFISLASSTTPSIELVLNKCFFKLIDLMQPPHLTDKDTKTLGSYMTCGGHK